MPKISVIVPVYKVEAYLPRCIDSILAQTFTDFELILVDDGSPDNCGKICDEYTEKDGRIIVVHKENGGVSAARNKAVDIASGEYITFVDSDDWLHPLFLERMYLKCIENNADASVSLIKRITNEDDTEGSLANSNSVFNSRQAIEYFAELNNEKFRAPMAKLVKSNIIKKHLFPEDRKYAEDTAVVYKWYFDAKKIVDSDDQLYFYYIRENSASHGKYNLSYLGVIDTTEELLAFFKNNNLKNPYKKFLSMYINSLTSHYYNLIKLGAFDLANVVKKKIKFTIKHSKGVIDTKFEDLPQAYAILYPRIIRCYSIFLKLKQKISVVKK